ncbi:MAG: hypothetical protein PHG85_03990, partial [Candidatus Altiarchaeota archaeon]|nr:hypothetical protein [Candidatus Altiarchaeota archaeon]
MDLLKETEATAYLKKADYGFSSGNYKSALGDYLKVVEFYVALGREDELAIIYRHIAECYHKMKTPLNEDARKNFRQAVDYFAKAAEIYAKDYNHPQAGDCYENAAKLCDELAELQKAVEHSLRSIVQYAKSGDLLSTSHAYFSTGQYYEKMGEMDKAADCYEKAAILNMRIKDFRRAASNYASAANCYRAKGDLDKVAGALANSVSANLKLRDYPKIADIYTEMADIYLKGNDVKNAAYYHKKAAELRFDNQDYAGTGQSYYNMGEMYDTIKDYNNACKSYIESAKTSLTGKSFEQAARAYEKAGECYEKMGDSLNASEYYVYSAKTSSSAGKENDANRTFSRAAKNYIDEAETKLIEKDYNGTISFYEKAIECYVGLENYEKVGETYAKAAEAHIKAKDELKAVDKYVKSAEAYVRAGDRKSAGYSYKRAGEYKKAAHEYAQYAEKKAAENDEFNAGEGFRLAARAYAKIDYDGDRRDNYSKAMWYYERSLKRKTTDSKDDLRLKADSAEALGECSVDVSDLRSAERYLHQAIELYKSAGISLGEQLGNAFLYLVQGQNALELGKHSQSLKSLYTSLNMFTSLVESGKFNDDAASYLSDQSANVQNLINKIELKPEVDLVVDRHAYTFTDTVLIINGILGNNSKYAIRSVSFLSHLPEEFDTVKLPPEMGELKAGESIHVSTEVRVKKPGEYVIKPFEIFYKDENDNKYVKASGDTMISVEERPPEDFKSFLMAVDEYLRYAKAQYANANYFYAGDGYKRAAEIYGRFNQDEKLKEYYL